MLPERREFGGDPSWQEILGSDPDHEKHLETSEGRFQAALNIIKNGAMVLEIGVMDSQWQNYAAINGAINRIYGARVCYGRVTHDHLVKTISVVGAAARSDIDDKDWKLTAFGAALRPAAIDAWQKILKLGINPAKVLTAVSSVKKDTEGNILDSAPYARTRMLLQLGQREEVRKSEIVKQNNLTDNTIHSHLKALKEAGLVNFESVDSIDSYTFFKPIATGKNPNDWPIWQDAHGWNQKALSESVQEAIAGLIDDGKVAFTTGEIIDWAKDNIVDVKSAQDRSCVNHVLNFLVRESLLARSEFNKDKRSAVSLTAGGQDFVEQVLAPLDAWARDANSVWEINDIRRQLAINPQAYDDLYRHIAELYRKTSPYVNRDPNAKTADILALIAQRPHEFTCHSLARELGISDGAVQGLTKPLIESLRIRVTVGKGDRRYFSVGSN